MTASRAALLEAFDELDTACAGNDPDAIARLFAGDPDIAFWGSAEAERALGPTELRALAAAIVAAPGSFRVEWRERHVHLEGAVAWVNASGLAAWDRGDGVTTSFPYRATGVLTRRDGVWLWHTFDGSEPQTD